LSKLYWMSVQCDAEDAARPSRHLSPGPKNAYILAEHMVIAIIR